MLNTATVMNLGIGGKMQEKISRMVVVVFSTQKNRYLLST
jgi:hypothetical protein